MAARAEVTSSVRTTVSKEVESLGHSPRSQRQVLYDCFAHQDPADYPEVVANAAVLAELGSLS